jgi:hypothetical protein
MALDKSTVALGLGLVGLFAIGCSCGDTPELHGCTDATCVGPKEETALVCECALDVSAAGETWTSNEDVSGLKLTVCLPPELNIHTANADQRAALEALSDSAYREQVTAYCASTVKNALTGLIGVLTDNNSDACGNVTATCVASPDSAGKATLVNEMCNMPCASVACTTDTCPACDVNDACEAGELHPGQVHPDQCKCTQASGCGVDSGDVCTTPTWAPDPPTIAVGFMARYLSQPSDVVIDREQSQAKVTATVDPGVPCASDSDDATTHIGGSVTLFGNPCPGEECDMLVDVALSADDVELNFDLGLLCGSATATAHSISITAGGMGIPIHLGTDGCGVFAPGELRLMASAVVNADGDVSRRTFDANNSRPVSLCADFVNNTFSMPSATLTLADGAVTMNLAGSIVNQPPFALAGAAQVVECDQAQAADVTLDGSQSTDPNGSDDLRLFSWWQGEALDPGANIGFGPTLATVAPLGTTTYQLVVSDLRFTTMVSETNVTVVDTTAPTISVSVSSAELWPPNHKMVEEVATVSVADVCDPGASFVLTSIVSNEPDDDGGDGNTVDDVQGAEFGTPDTTFLLRAERNGDGTGRTYTVTYTATDAAGHSQDSSVVVTVPHDRRK